MGEKTEKATPKKLRDARKKGQVAKSQDFPIAFTFITSITVVMSMMSYLFGLLSDFFFAAFGAIEVDIMAALLNSVHRMFLHLDEVWLVFSFLLLQLQLSHLVL